MPQSDATEGCAESPAAAATRSAASLPIMWVRILIRRNVRTGGLKTNEDRHREAPVFVTESPGRGEPRPEVGVNYFKRTIFDVSVVFSVTRR